MSNLKSRLQRIEGKAMPSDWQPVTRIVRVMVGIDRKPMVKADGTLWEIVRSYQR